ncbi:MAG: SDR family oxidoreductase [Coprothermobacterota bacterium]|nr:SDR family oxidoreductase [Coprothermobacterota bacterium]
MNILITGTTSGIGLTTALHLIARGHRVVGTSRHPEIVSKDELKQRVLADHTRYRLADGGRKATPIGSCLPPSLQDLDGLLAKLHVVSMAMDETTAVKKGVEDALVLLDGRIDVLHSNAGMGIFGAVEEVDEKLLSRQFEANVFGPQRLLRQILPLLRAQRFGKILFTSSIGGLYGIPFQSHYSASKSALERIAEGLANEVKPFGIQVAVIEPGDINTAFNRTTAEAVTDLRKAAGSADLTQLLEAFPLPTTSPYWKRAGNTWNYIIRTLPLKPSPSAVARLVVRLVEAKHLHGFRYTAGEWSQRILPFARRLLPDKVAESVMSAIYELNKR